MGKNKIERPEIKMDIVDLFTTDNTQQLSGHFETITLLHLILTKKQNSTLARQLHKRGL